MTKTGLPKITIYCPAGHPVETRASGGSTAQCFHIDPDGRIEKPDGSRRCGLYKRVPSDRPRSIRELAAWNAEQGISESANGNTPDSWANITPWDGKFGIWSDHSPGPCPKCGQPLAWEQARTFTMCLTCKVISLPETVTISAERATGIRKSAEIASQPDPESEMKARMVGHVKQQQALRACDSWLRLASPERYQRGTYEYNVATQLHDEFSAARAEITAARDPDTLNLAIRMHNGVAREAQQYVSQLKRELARIERDSQPDDDNEYDEPDDDEPDNDEPDDDDYRDREYQGTKYTYPHGATVIEQGQITYPPAARDNPASVDTAAFTRLILESPSVQKSRIYEARRAKYGPCQFHRSITRAIIGVDAPAPTRYVTGNNEGISGHTSYGAPTKYICDSRKCLDAADRWFQSQGWRDCTFGPLS